MMPASSNIILSIASSDPVFSAGGRTRALTVLRSARARRMRLAIDPRDGGVRLTLPRSAQLAAALAWVESQRGWVERALAEVPGGQPLHDGATLPFEGGVLTIDWRAGGTRTVRREGERLVVGGPEELVAGRVLRWLKRQALDRLAAETRVFAHRAGVSVASVAVGDPRSRWGSCSTSGAIRFSWRLVMAPPEVLRATVAHEVAHRLHMDHSPRFHRAVADLLGHEPKAERAWLRAHGAGLHAIGRE